MKSIEICGKRLGTGRPNTIVPIVARCAADILTSAAALNALPLDVVEWRADLWQEAATHIDVAALGVLLADLRAALCGKVLLVTYRRTVEGGEGSAGMADYIAFCKAVAQSGHADLLDIELSIGEDTMRELLAVAHAHGVPVVASSHNFSKTPTQSEMLDTLCAMHDCGADIAKIAVMPTCKSDVLALFAATADMAERHPETPLITMSMGTLGQASRVCGATFGSAMTFASVGDCSAPGQIPLDAMNTALDALYGAH